MTIKKTLILIRHAHRDTIMRELDNGLSETGIEQARKIQKELGPDLKERRVEILSSPRARCIETVGPLSEKLGLEIEIAQDLCEQESGESDRDFRARIVRFCQEWKKRDAEVVVACSHGDVLPLCVYEHLGEEYLFKKGEFVEIKLTLKA